MLGHRIHFHKSLDFIIVSSNCLLKMLSFEGVGNKSSYAFKEIN
jgi:hypothetical protein